MPDSIQLGLHDGSLEDWLRGFRTCPWPTHSPEEGASPPILVRPCKARCRCLVLREGKQDMSPGSRGSTRIPSERRSVHPLLDGEVRQAFSLSPSQTSSGAMIRRKRVDDAQVGSFPLFAVKTNPQTLGSHRGIVNLQGMAKATKARRRSKKGRLGKAAVMACRPRPG